MGETLGDYLGRRRLDVAALRLACRPPVPVLEIALTVGFGSGEAFARAFKRRFGLTPSAWRAATPQRWADELTATRRRHEERNLDQTMRKQNQSQDPDFRNDLGSIKSELIMQVNITTLPAVRVAYMRHIGPYGASISRFWSETFLPWRMAHGLDSAPCYGIGHDDPTITAPGKCRYDACVAVPADFVAKSPVSIAELPGGRYAVAQFKGTGPDIGLAWTELLRDWLPNSGMQADSRPFFEFYPSDACYNPDTGVFDCQICLPVRPL